LIEALLRAGQIAVVLDGMNEADRGLALTAFSRQFKTTPLLVTSQAMPGSDRSDKPDDRWKVWELPNDLSEMRLRLLSLWLGERRGAILDQRISTEKLSAAIVSGYDLRLIADLAESDPEHTQLPPNRAALYRTILAHVTGVDGEPLDLEGLKKLAWLMVTQRRRRIQPDDETLLGRGILQLLTEKNVPIIRTVNGQSEFRHDQMRAFLAALWLIEETPGILALQRATTESHAFDLNRRDQEDLWGFLAPLLKSAGDLQELWTFANDDPVERAVLIAALQAEADTREISLTRFARQATLPLT
jgi:hypothetical protein